MCCVLCVCVVCVCVLCVLCVVCVCCAYLLVYLLNYLLISPELHFGGWLQGLSLEAFWGTGGPGQGPGQPKGSGASLWRFFRPRTAQATQMAPGPHFGGFAGHGQRRPPKWLQDLILKAFRLTCGPDHPNGSRASFWRLFEARAARATQMAAGPHFGDSPGHLLTYLPTYVPTDLLTYLLTYLRTE